MFFLWITIMLIYVLKTAYWVPKILNIGYFFETIIASNFTLLSAMTYEFTIYLNEKKVKTE